MVLGSKGRSLLTRHSWPVFSQLCPAVVACGHSEKPSIIRVWSAVVDTAVHHLDCVTIRQLPRLTSYITVDRW